MTAIETSKPANGAQASVSMRFEEYLATYEGIRAEWVNGEVTLLGMTNNVQHNTLVLWLGMVFSYFLARHGLGRVILAGVPMRFTFADEGRAREPDLMVVLKANATRITPRYVDGLADMVIEVISPESDLRDRGEKFLEYEAAGVPEYFLIDPLRSEAILYQRGADGRYHPATPDSQGRLCSGVLPGFALPPALLWADLLPEGDALIALVNGMG